MVEFLISTKLPILHEFLTLVPGLIRANGPTVQLSPIVAPKIIVLGLTNTFFPILHLFKKQLCPIVEFSPMLTSSSKTQLISISTFLLTRKFPRISVLEGSLINVPASSNLSAFCLRYFCSRLTRSFLEFTPVTSNSFLNLNVATL